MRGAGLAILHAATVVAIVVVGSAGLWLGLPLAWLWVGSHVQVATGSLAAALGAAMLGFVLSLIAVMLVLGRLDALHGRLRRARGREDHGHVLAEGVVVASAILAGVGSVVWFLLFAGASPLPLQTG